MLTKAFPVSTIRELSGFSQSPLNTCSQLATSLFIVKSSILEICHKTHAIVSSFEMENHTYALLLMGL